MKNSHLISLESLEDSFVFQKKKKNKKLKFFSMTKNYHRLFTFAGGFSQLNNSSSYLS